MKEPADTLSIYQVSVDLPKSTETGFTRQNPRAASRQSLKSRI